MSSAEGDASVHTAVTNARLCHTPFLGVARPGSVPFVSDRPGAYGFFFLAVCMRWRWCLLIGSDR